jgi:hypothetical protein
MTTFGELSALADAHLSVALDVARSASRDPVGCDHSGTAAAFTRMTEVLARFTDEIATGFGADPLALPEAVREQARIWTTEAHSCSTLLRGAQTTVPVLVGDPSADSPVASRIGAAADLLGCGLDLLKSHFTGPTRTPTGPTATVVTHPDTSRHLLGLVGRNAATLTRIADLTEPGLKTAGGRLAEVAQNAVRAGGPGTAPITGVAAHTQTTRREPVPGETQVRAMAGISASAQRVINAEGLTGVRSWRYTAAGASITHHLGSMILARLADHLGDRGQHGNASQLRETVDRLNEAGSSWRSIAGYLRKTTVGDGQPPYTPLAQDISDLVVRLGRLIHTDPHWTPDLRSATALRSGPELAPDPKTIAGLALSVLHTVDAFRVLADQHHRSAQKVLPAGPLLDGYAMAHQRGTHATITLADTVLTLNHNARQPAIAGQAALIQQRADLTQAATALAGSDFPISITTAIQSPPAQAGRPPVSAQTSTIARRP